MIRRVGNYSIIGVLIIVFSGCSMAWEAHTKARISDDELFPTVIEMVDQQREVIWPYLDEEVSRALGSTIPSAEQIVANTLGEERGRQYLEFCYTVGWGDTEEDVERVVSFANSLLDEQGQMELDEKLTETRAILMQRGEHLARALKPSQRAAFWKDMQQLVTRTLVLFTAGVVYACIPTVVFWGKVTAAAAIAVATGVVASTVMSIWRYYQFGGSADESFSEWIDIVTKEPEISYALTGSVMAVGKTLKRGPVVTGIIICVFALYNVVDMVKPMLKKYDFTV